MTWLNTLIFAGAAAYMLGGSPIEIVLATMSSNYPKRISEIYPLEREVTHEVFIWAVLLGFIGTLLHLFNFEFQVMYPYDDEVKHVTLLFFLLGPMAHLFGDYLSDKGVFVGKQKYTINLFEHNSRYENAYVFFFTLISIVIYTVTNLLGIKYNDFNFFVKGIAFITITQSLIKAFQRYIAKHPPYEKPEELYVIKKESTPPTYTPTEKPGFCRPGNDVQGTRIVKEDIPLNEASTNSVFVSPGGSNAQPKEHLTTEDPKENPVFTKPIEKPSQDETFQSQIRKETTAECPTPLVPEEEKENLKIQKVFRFDDEILSNAWDELIEPVHERLENVGMMDFIEETFKVFKSIGHKVSSICNADIETPGKTNDDFGLLKNVSLIEHSFNVARIAMEKLQQEDPTYWKFKYQDYLIGALFHDIGKAKEIQNLGYKSTIHQTNSVGYFASFVKAKHPDMPKKTEEIIEHIIRHHHYTSGLSDTSKDPKVTKELIFFQKCDQSARLYEKDCIRTKRYNDQRSADSPEGAELGPNLSPSEQLESNKRRKEEAQKAKEAKQNPESAQPSPSPSPDQGPPPMDEPPPIADNDVGNFNNYTEDNSAGELYVNTHDSELGPIIRRYEITSKGKPVEIVARQIPDVLLNATLKRFKEQYINKFINPNQFLAFSQKDGLVYCFPDSIYETLRDEAEDHGYHALWYSSLDYKETVLHSFYETLRQKHLAAPVSVIAPNYYARDYHFWNQSKDLDPKETDPYTYHHYMIIPAATFGLNTEHLESERKKTQFFSTIKAVLGPVRKKNKNDS